MKGGINMKKRYEKRNEQENKNEQYPIEFPSRNGKTENSPIVDNVVESETFPLRFDGTNGIRNQSGVHINTFDQITEVVTTEAVASDAEPNRPEQHI